ncbi:TBC1 domain family member 4-like isoform X2 [Amphibalanus amphitrite]|uniref:TBC1 domain family member 4-like isoform X2 n=1 Tax=Amphibalanus amphitrite TaxID=1232801 RepID=UPI001C902552|nr:TBC1 domain family member 4-like isoform X2 [Amphibalanus amphitrite]
MESQRYSALYLGHTVVSSGYSKHMIPWVVKEVLRQARSEQVTLQLKHGSLVVASSSGGVVATHPVLQLSHFSQTVADPRCFLYFVRGAQAGSHAMYLYQLRDKDMVSELFATIREHSRRTQQIQRSQSDTSSINMSQLRRACGAAGAAAGSGLNPQTASYFEVQYVCKIKTSHRKGPPSFIDDALQEFGEFKRRTASQAGGLALRSTPDDALYLQGDHALRSGSTDSVNSVGSCQSSASLPPSGRHGSEGAEETGSTGRLTETVSEPSTPIAVPKIVNIPPTPQSTPCDRQLSTVAESAELDPLGSPASIPRSASADGEVTEVTGGGGGTATGPFRTRAMSGDTARMRRRSAVHQEEAGGRLRAGSVGSSLMAVRRRLSSMDHNYTMLFQVGKLELQMISPDNKAVKLHKFFRDISQITQGVKNSDHFGFICREFPTPVHAPGAATGASGSGSAEGQPSPAPTPPPGGSHPKGSFVGYIFRCQNDKIAEDVINTLTQAFRNAHEMIRQSKRQAIQQCDYCPTVWFNKLCAELEGLSPEVTQTVVVRALDCLPADERRELLVKLAGAQTVDAAEQNELLMSLLRFLCDEKQRKHTHVTAGQPLPPHGYDSHNLLFDLSSGLNKAKRSLTSRLEQVWKYNRTRDESRDVSGSSAQPDQLVMHQGSASTTPETSPCPTPTKADFRYEYPSDSPVASRPRSSTIAGSSRDGYRREYRGKTAAQPARNDSPMVAIFKKMGQSPRGPEPLGPGLEGTPRTSPASWRQAIFNRIRTPVLRGCRPAGRCRRRQRALHHSGAHLRPDLQADLRAQARLPPPAGLQARSLQAGELRRATQVRLQLRRPRIRRLRARLQRPGGA